MPKIEIDYDQCDKIAAHIAETGGVPKDEEDPMALSFPSFVAENAWCAVVAICHQTTPVEGEPFRGYVGGTLRRGWDYLLQKSIEKANIDETLFTREWLYRVSASDLQALYHDDREGNTLNRLEERAALLRNLGRFLTLNGWESIRRCHETSDGFIHLAYRPGIAEWLKRVEAFQDPVEKKLFYFLTLMKNQGFWTYKDPEKVSSPVDYHEQRGHFRLGTVRLLDRDLERTIRARENISAQDDVEIRFAVRRAIEYMADKLRITPAMAHYFFWNYFRNCCSRESVHCGGCGKSCKLPERYRTHDSCRFVAVCKSSSIQLADMLIEPRLDDTIWQ